MSKLRVLILGAGAGGGLPQWNCGCVYCDKARRGEIPSLTQSSIAVSLDGARWAILNASPDVRVQVAQNPPLHPTGLRESPIHSVLVTNADIDHVAGLLTLREKQPFVLWATEEIQNILASNPMYSALASDVVDRQSIELERSFEILPGLAATLFAVPGKVPLYMEGDTVVTDLEGEQTVGVEIRIDEQRLYYIPGCARMTDKLADRVRGADMVLFDGTVWVDNEMESSGLGHKTGQRMGHMMMSGQSGSIAAFENLGVDRKIFVHMNNSNPVVDPSSEQRRDAEAAGWIVSSDGMEFTI